MSTRPENPSQPVARPSFFGVPPNVNLWARVGPKFWGGVLLGLGLGLFVASWLEELGIYRTVWTGFVAVILVGAGLGIALRGARRF